MQMAIDVAGFTPGRGRPAAPGDGLEAQSAARMERLRERLYDGHGRARHHRRGRRRDLREAGGVRQLRLPREPLGVSFAYLVYASSWIKYHEPAAFCAALLNAQPMGFYSPHSLVQDARRHGVVVRTPDLNASLATATLEPCSESVGDVAVRLGIGSVRGIGDDLAEEIERAARPVRRRSRTWCAGCRSSRSPSSRRWPPPACSASASGSSGARRCGRSARSSQSRPDRLEGVVTGDRRAARCRAWTPMEEAVADLWATGVSPDGHPDPVPARRSCDELGVVTAAGLWECRADEQGAGGRGRHPPPAADDRPGHHVPQPRGRDRADQRRRVEGLLGALPHGRPRARRPCSIRGRLERSEGVINIVAEHLDALPLAATTTSPPPSRGALGVRRCRATRYCAAAARCRQSHPRHHLNCSMSSSTSVRTVSAATLAIRHTTTCPDGDRSVSSPAGSRPTAPTRRFDTPSAAADIAASPAASVLGGRRGCSTPSANPSTLATSAPTTPGTPWTSWSNKYRIEPMISVATPRYRRELTKS